MFIGAFVFLLSSAMLYLIIHFGSISFAFLFLGAFLIIGGLRMPSFNVDIRLRKNPHALRCEGTVVSVAPVKGPSGANIRPDGVTVQFYTLDKQENIIGRVDDRLRMSVAGQYEEGQKVTVIYNSDNPREFALVTKHSPWMAQWIVLGLGGVFVLIGALMFL